MMQYTQLAHQFVTNLPDRLEPGVLYISIDYATAAHLCCCGCGAEVVTPFTPTDWRMTFDGETISLQPSIGNWNEACRSHYVINRSQVIEAPTWSDDRVAAEWQRDKSAKKKYYGIKEHQGDLRGPAHPLSTAREPVGLWFKVKRWFRD